MKKTNIAVMLIIIITLAFSGCTNNNTTIKIPESSTVNPTQETTPTQTVEEIPNIDNVALSDINDEDASNPSYYVKTSLPKVEVLKNSELEQKINDDVTEIKETLLESLYSVEVPEGVMYGVEISYDSNINEKGLLNLNIYAIYNTGTPHPYMEYSSLNYNLNNGTPITISDIFIENCDYTSVIVEKIDAIIATQDDEIKESYFVDTKDFLDYGIVSLGQTELLFKYAPSEIAPYAVGEISFAIPYTDLEEILADEYKTILLK